MSNFRVQSKQLFLTFPQVVINKQQAHDRILEHFKDKLDCFIVSQEKHQDGGNHLHLYISFNKIFQTTRQNYFDFIADKHPNIQSVKNRLGVINYVIKDGDYICYRIDPKTYVKEVKEHQPRQSKGKFAELTDRINEGIEKGNLSLKELKNEFGELFIRYADHIDKYIKMCRNLKIKDETEDYYSQIYSSCVWSSFQQKILDLVLTDKIEERKINWIYDPKGNSGKSFLGRYLKLYKDAYIITGGKSADIYRHYDYNKIVVYDLPRDYMSENISLYSTMECFKNGYLLDTKFEGGQKIFKPPQIIVFSNNLPDTTKLSKDRWNIIYLEDIVEDNVEDVKEEVKIDEVEEQRQEEIEVLEDTSEEHLEDNQPLTQPIKVEQDNEVLKRIVNPDHKHIYLNRYEYNEFVKKYWDTKENIWIQLR